MIFFKSRHEIKVLRQEVEALTDMLKTHFGIMYTLEDFKKWYDLHPRSDGIPVTEGDRVHFIEMIKPAGQTVEAKDIEGHNLFHYRDKHVFDRDEDLLLRLERIEKTTAELLDIKQLAGKDAKTFGIHTNASITKPNQLTKKGKHGSRH